MLSLLMKRALPTPSSSLTLSSDVEMFFLLICQRMLLILVAMIILFTHLHFQWSLSPLTLLYRHMTDIQCTNLHMYMYYVLHNTHTFVL